jgi:hypothetical protein
MPGDSMNQFKLSAYHIHSIHDSSSVWMEHCLLYPTFVCEQSCLAWTQACLEDRILGLLETRASFPFSRLGLSSKRCRYAVTKCMSNLFASNRISCHVPEPRGILLDKASIRTSVPNLIDDIVHYNRFICSSLGLDIPR